MIDVKKAVQIAKAGASEMLSEGSASLEEIEREDYKGRDVWSITLGFPLKPGPVTSPLAESLTWIAAHQLRYKRFLIDVETGELLAVKLRETVSQ